MLTFLFRWFIHNCLECELVLDVMFMSTTNLPSQKKMRGFSFVISDISRFDWEIKTDCKMEGQRTMASSFKVSSSHHLMEFPPPPITVTFGLVNINLELYFCTTWLYNLLFNPGQTNKHPPVKPPQLGRPRHPPFPRQSASVIAALFKTGLRRSKVREQCLQTQDLPRWTTHGPGRFVAVEALVRQASPANRWWRRRTKEFHSFQSTIIHT